MPPNKIINKKEKISNNGIKIRTTLNDFEVSIEMAEIYGQLEKLSRRHGPVDSVKRPKTASS